MTKNLSDKFVELLYDLRTKTFSASVISQVKKCLIDYIGVSYAGARMVKDKGNSVLDFHGNSNGDISIIGFDRKVSIESAIFLNGISSHIAELDDGVRYGGIHPGSPLFSVLLPIAEQKKVSVHDLIIGVITGYEASVRLAMAVQPSHYNRGYHPTSTCGSIGAALGVAAMLGFSKVQMKDTLSAAAISAAGTLKVIEDESEMKPINTGRAALNAFLSTSVAMAGFSGPIDALSGDNGFLSMVADKYDSAQLLKSIGDEFCIEKVYFKPYAACRHAHPSIEAVLNIKSKYELNINTIESIIIRTYQGVLGKHDHTDVYGVSSAKMSIPYSVAVALLTGGAGIGEFSKELVEDPEVISLTKKVEVLSDIEITRQVPHKRSSIVEINTNEGSKFVNKVDYPKGEPENPLTDEEVESKFIMLSALSDRSKEESRMILDIVWNLENDLESLFKQL
jgi:2-methylcitrate dehydratase PrpD